MLATSQLDVDPRIDKTARSLARRGFEVQVLHSTAGVRHAGVEERDAASGVCHVRVPLPDRLASGWLLFQENLRREAMSREFDFVHANDLTTLLTGWLLARVRGVPLVYDAHELWSENVWLTARGYEPMPALVRKLATLYEGALVRSVALFFSVSRSICAEYQRRYRLADPPVLLPNFPEVERLRAAGGGASIRELCGLGDAHFVTLYLGGVNPLRNVENVIRAHHLLPPEYVFVVRGPGLELCRDGYAALARSLGLEERVFMLPAVARDDVLGGCRGADCGIAMLRNLCRNFYWFYPNKLFEYMLAGLPVLVSGFPDVAAHVTAESCGLTFDPDRPESIAAAIRALGGDPAAARAMGRRGQEGVLREFNWEAVAGRLVDGYARLTATPAA